MNSYILVYENGFQLGCSTENLRDYMVELSKGEHRRANRIVACWNIKCNPMTPSQLEQIRLGEEYWKDKDPRMYISW